MNWRNDKLERKGEGLGVVKEEGESEKGREKVGGVGKREEVRMVKLL